LPRIPVYYFLIYRRKIRGRPVENSEFSIDFGDGRSLDLLGNAVPLKNEAGEVLGAVGAFIDVTERNSAEKSVRQHEAILRTVLENTSDSVFLKDCAGRYLAINPSGARLVGKVPEDFLGKDDAAVFPAEVAEMYMRRDREVITSGVSAIFEEEILLDGRLRLMQTMRDLCRDADGTVIGVLGITRDVTEHKRLASDGGMTIFQRGIDSLRSTVHFPGTSLISNRNSPPAIS
jgi:PAS domain S-box-containing protein